MAEGWFDINHWRRHYQCRQCSLTNSTLYSQRFSFFDESEYRLYSLCKNWSQVFSLHPCDWEFMFLSCWCCLRTESSFSKAEDLASQIGCYWHGPKLDWWVALATATLQHPHQPHKKSDGLSEGRLTWLSSIYSLSVPFNQVRSKCTRGQKAWNFPVGRVLRANTPWTKYMK